jgi:programmed cell death protein 4
VPGLDDLKGAAALNEHDPNYDEEDGTGAILEVIDVDAKRQAERQVETIKTEILDLLDEYVEEGDLQETMTALKIMNNIPAAEFIKRALILGIERHTNERELVSRLLNELFALFEGKGYSDGFQALLYRLPDLVIDVPDAADYLGLFAARALYDECLAPAFLKDAIVDNEAAKQAMTLAYNVYHLPSERARLEHVWGAAALDSVESLSAAVDAILKEYFDSLEVAECTRAVVELHAPSFRGQIVYQAIVMALEKDSAKARLHAIDLLSHWLTTGVLTDFYIKQGVESARKAIDDLLPDLPHARSSFDALVLEAKQKSLPF